MTNGIFRSDSNWPPSFEEFKETVLHLGAKTDFISKAANKYGALPRLIRILTNLDPIGVASAIDQLLSETLTDKEQENILRTIYQLAIKVWQIEELSSPSLPDEIFKFLFFVYIKSETNVYARVNVDELQNALDLSQHRILSIGQYLEQNGYIEFGTWVGGINITHKGIRHVEAGLLGKNQLPNYVGDDEISKIEQRISLRLALLKYIFKETGGDTLSMVLHSEMATNLGLDHLIVISQPLPYMSAEGWIILRTNDSVSITEEGIQRAKFLSY